MPRRKQVTKEQIERHLVYVPERGAFIRRYNYWGHLAGENVESSVTKHGVFILIDNSLFSRKHLVWVMERHAYPEDTIIRIDGNVYNDRIDNLLRLPGKDEELTLDVAQKLFTYDPVSGRLTRKINYGNTKPGSLGAVNSGYYRFKVGQNIYKAHRLAWFLTYGGWPENIDHINGVRSDNRLENLRAATAGENSKNVAKRTGTKTGEAGITINENPVNKYSVRVGNNHDRVHVGVYSNLEEAIQARDAALKQYGYHPNHGKTPEERAEYEER
jgi:hypothetical protein